ncbi:MAG: CheR family methyltransferase [Nostoc sp.]|uniref:CheR family methyltransferase n=1 Tax=Nostoc sp. TaxID=1180 RepID=UPI002FF88509
MTSNSPAPDNSSKLNTSIASDLDQPNAPFPVVGIAASAGGLEAFTELISYLPTDTGMSFVLIQHLSPDYESLLSEILGRVTEMVVYQAQDQMIIEPNKVYVIPPNTQMTLRNGMLHLAPRQKTSGRYMPGDTFFSSLAAEQGNKAIAIVLSGTDGDGAQGLKAVKVAGGVTFAQSQSTARFDDMPNTAVATGNVDFVLPPEAIAEKLVALSHSPFLLDPKPLTVIEQPPQPGDALTIIFALLRTRTGVDFTLYKPTTLDRRIQRRMLLYKLENLEDYAQYLQAHPNEVQALYEEILIHVTSFFRDPEAFEYLKTQVFPSISQNKSVDNPIRIWVAGCSTGEEVYTIAICLLEFFSDCASLPPIQIFATDISETAIDKARSGFYLDTQLQGISPQRRNRFFVALASGGYQVSSTVRELCVFARHNLGSDPPFSNLDLISCRNVLIYLSDSLQEYIMSLFHYSLNLAGFLMLGSSESVKNSSDLFKSVNETLKIYARNLSLTRPLFSFTTSSYPTRSIERQRRTETITVNFDLAREVEQIISNRYAPVSVVVDNQMQILQLRGDTDLYLKLPADTTNLNVLLMAREGLTVALQTAIYQAQTQNLSVRQEQIRIEAGERSTILNLEVIPFKPATATTNPLYFLLIFEAALPAVQLSLATAQSQESEKESLEREIIQLRQALAAVTQREFLVQAHLQAVVQEHNYLNQSLRVANEEIVSSNEELQSTNEELQTAKEEIQATNEELSTTNDELRSRNLRQNRDNSDLNNFIDSINIPIVMLTNDLIIHRFTPAARRLFNFILADVGRPFSDIRTNFDVPNLESMILEVLETLNTKEQEIQTQAGYWYTLRIRPYRTTENQIDGVTMVFQDVDALKRHTATLELARQQAETANRAKDEFLSNLSHELRNPLNIIQGWTQMLRTRRLDQATVTSALEIIERNVKAQSQLINDILDTSRIVNGKLNLSTRPIDLLLVVQAAIETVQLLAEAKNIQIVSNLSSEIIVGDTERLQQVLYNLLLNAIKFTPEGGRVEVRLMSDRTHVQVQVSDTGQGISPDLLPYIFERFRQGDSSTTKAKPGLGLGLSIAQYLVELHGGTIQAESLGSGQGATFTVRLPKRDLQEEFTLSSDLEPTALEVAPDRLSDPVPSLSGLQILAVDDQADARDILKFMLEGYGAEVLTVASARVALAVISKNPSRYDLLICDLGMPQEDGYWLIRQVRSLSAEAGGQIPAIVLTAYVSESEQQLSIEAGFQMHVAKPVEPDRLALFVADLTGRA